jgi:hypothetical protein
MELIVTPEKCVATLYWFTSGAADAHPRSRHGISGKSY